jgi:putative GTP pyrophosphokinase
MTKKDSNKVIDDAILWYSENKSKFEQLGKKVESIIKELILDNDISIHEIYSRAKEISSFSKKIEGDKYTDPINQIMDCSGIRVIAYVESDLDKISKIIIDNFEIDNENSVNKTTALGIDKVGYRSIHYIAKLRTDRLKLPEYKKFKDFVFEIQIRTILQHAWAEIEHDKDYKFSGELPSHLKRRFKVLAGVLELADREFNEIANAIDNYSFAVNDETQKGELNIEIDSTSLQTYLDFKLSDLISKDLLDTTVQPSRDVISEVKLMGIVNLKDFENIIRKDYSKKLLQFSPRKRSYNGIVRDILMIYDIEKYFSTAWSNHWGSMLGETVSTLKAYNVDIDKYITQHNLKTL